MAPVGSYESLHAAIDAGADAVYFGIAGLNMRSRSSINFTLVTDQPIPDADHTWYTDGSSFLQEGQRKAGAAVTTETEVIWARALPAGTSAQRAELIALTQALKMSMPPP